MVVEVIKWDDHSAAANDIIVWKHECEDFSCAAQLLVGTSQVALFVNEGQIVPFLPGHYTLDESNNSMFGFINKWRNRLSKGVSSFHCQVYYVNMVTLQDLKFGTTDPIQMQDVEEGVNIHVRAAGLFGAHIDNDDKDGKNVIKFFTNVVGVRQSFSKTDLADYLRGKIVERVKDLLGKTLITNNIGILKVSQHYTMLSDSLKMQMTPFFADYGIAIDNFSFMSINVPDEDLKELNDSKIAARKMDLESEAMARKRAREGYSYQQERGFDVLGQAASNEGTPSQFMGAGMGLGMGIGVGGAFGGAMGGMAQNAFGSMNYPPQGGAPMNGYPQGGAPMNGYPQNGAPMNGYPQGGYPQNGAPNSPQAGAPQSVATQVCPNCGVNLPATAKFCFNCGAKLSNNCPNCGAEILPGAKFCPSCGTKLN